ncbi:hypothetical protein SAMN04490191_3428 [Pseudomonas lini]|uniref:Uncharacterized protein n=1 Tax=Pseudomonas lini TaxID=163011 RepID=A0A1H1YAZ1_9PSED|nr:hypothetical protein SAMN04490191_3428 [Pseudomonas lini]
MSLWRGLRIRAWAWAWAWVYIRFCGNGCYWFRSYSGLLGKAPSNQALLPLSFGASPRLAMPSLRSCSVGPPPSAIHGRGRLTRHPCRVAHCAEPPLGLSRGRIPQKHREAAYRPAYHFKRTHSPVMIVPTLRVGMHPVTLCVTIAQDSSLASRAERGASPAAFPRGAWERSEWERLLLLCFALLCFALAFDFDLDLPRRKAERRFCAVGTAARMPR